MAESGFPKLFVTDLDGTALGGGYEPYARLPDPFSEFLDRLAERGCLWAINTTWGVQGQWHLVQQSAVRSRPAFLMGEVGYRLVRVVPYGDGGCQLEKVQPYSSETERELREARARSLLPLIKDLCSRFRHERMNFFGHWFDMAPDPEDAEAFSACVLKRFYPEESPATARATWEAESDPRGPCTRGLFSPSGTDGLTTLLREGGRRLIAFPDFLGKGRSLRAAIEAAGLTPDDVVVAGDEVMDLHMMRPSCARLLVCPGNSEEQVKSHVLERDGAVGEGASSRGVIQAFEALARKRGWEW